MFKSLTYISAAMVALVACDGHNQSDGIASLGPDFVKAFRQDRNAEPFDASELRLSKTPRKEPFNP